MKSPCRLCVCVSVCLYYATWAYLTDITDITDTSFNTISTRRHIPEDGILHGHRRENLKSYIFNVTSFS
jgi:hypothetical protein